MVQIEARVSGQVQLLKLGWQILRESDLAQLIAAQIHTLTTEGKDVNVHTNAYAPRA